MFLSLITRPDISHALSYLSQFNNNHDEIHWKSAKRALKYLKKTANYRLTYQIGETICLTESHTQVFVISFWRALYPGKVVNKKQLRYQAQKPNIWR